MNEMDILAVILAKLGIQLKIFPLLIEGKRVFEIHYSGCDGIDGFFTVEEAELLAESFKNSSFSDKLTNPFIFSSEE